MIFCKKLNKEAEPLGFAPMPGELGERILQNISAEGWQLWIKHQTMLINEKHLSLANPETRAYLTGEMEKFLFGGDYDKVEGYVPPKNENKL
ncbi:MAG: oxidative damage protection protein [Gammaproteobacteria bacterium]|nr:oxidative damage protection protein [Gammaproteobacteria bacterium]MDH5631261.1 oxidative damage protection protein [Gammaproteobacteria bacterium]